jgi:TRAP-type mannitol/chloroaromatic compound transport system permease large subunit
LTETIINVVPVLRPMLKHFNVDPILWGTLVFVNLQAAFLSPHIDRARLAPVFLFGTYI